MKLRLPVLATAVILCGSGLYAHDLFIKFDDYFLDPQVEVRVPILNGTFAASENPITPDRVTAIALVEASESRRLGTQQWDASSDTTYLTFRTGPPGTHLLGVSTQSKLIELDAKSFNDYLEHDGIPDVLEIRQRRGELDRDVVERYSKHVKAVFQVGEARGEGWDRVLGFPAEIVPLSNPYELRAGGELAVRCLLRGRPVANQLVIAGGERGVEPIAESEARTDEAGVARFKLERAGRWYVKFIHMVQTSEEDVDYESNWATLTFQVR